MRRGDQDARARGRFQGVVSVATGNKSCHVVKRDGSVVELRLLRLVDHLY